MRALVAVPIAACLLWGCDVPASREDSELKTALAGTWSYEFKDVHERAIKGVVDLGERGTFTVREKTYGVENPPEEKSSGEWHVTEGLLKLKTNQIDGRPLGTVQTLYFTCKVGSISKSEFTCIDQITKKMFNYRRVASGSAPS
jgi:hypothetical protein